MTTLATDDNDRASSRGHVPGQPPLFDACGSSARFWTGSSAGSESNAVTHSLAVFDIDGTLTFAVLGDFQDLAATLETLERATHRAE